MTNNNIKEFVTTQVCKDCENHCWCDLDAMVFCACKTLELDGFRLIDLVDTHYDEYMVVELYIERWQTNRMLEEL